MTKTIKIETEKFYGTYEVNGEKVTWVQYYGDGRAVRTTVARGTSRYKAVIERA